MAKYIIPDQVSDLIIAHSIGLEIQLNGSAVNGGYGETWNRVENFDPTDLYSLDCYRIVSDTYYEPQWRKPSNHMDIANASLLGYQIQFNKNNFDDRDSPEWENWDESPIEEPYKYRISYEKIKQKPKAQHVEITLKFEVSEDFEYDNIPMLMRREFPNYNYNENFVCAQIITDNSLGAIYTQNRLEELEQKTSLIVQMLTENSDKYPEGLCNSLYQHNKYFRDTKGK